MSTSFIVFLVAAVIIVAVAAFRMGAKVSKASKQEAPEAQNNKSYDECLSANEKAFKYGSFTDARDGETYRTVQIGNQVWMAENLRFKCEDSFAPQNDEKNVKQFGRLYTWTAAMNIPGDFSEQAIAKDIDILTKVQDKNYQGIAPEGWHIPSDKEWEDLIAATNGNAEDALRSACSWQHPGKDTLGFFALPAGYRFGNGNTCNFGKRARFWSKTEYGKTNAYRMSITTDSADIEGVYRTDALSIRCVKNA